MKEKVMDKCFADIEKLCKRGVVNTLESIPYLLKQFPALTFDNTRTKESLMGRINSFSEYDCGTKKHTDALHRSQSR